MASRPETMTITKKAPPVEETPEPVGQRRPKTERYHLQVDRQTKATYSTSEAAEKAGKAIKKGHPVVQVAIYDTVTSTNTLIEAG